MGEKIGQHKGCEKTEDVNWMGCDLSYFIFFATSLVSS